LSDFGRPRSGRLIGPDSMKVDPFFNINLIASQRDRREVTTRNKFRIMLIYVVALPQDGDRWLRMAMTIAVRVRCSGSVLGSRRVG
jgi:hypothetical protein